MEPIATPALNQALPKQCILQYTAFSFSIAKGFAGEVSTYQLANNPLNWLHINKTTGIIYGVTPKVPCDQQYLIEITAANTQGNTRNFFILKILKENFIEHITQPLLTLKLIRKHWHLEDPQKQPHLRKLLEFIYAYFQQSPHKDSFNALWKSKDTKSAHTTHYKDFETVITKINPTIEKQLEEELRAHSPHEHWLMEVELTHNEMANLFREGGQPLGITPFPVWNYLGMTSYHNWSEVHTILHMAVHAIRHMLLMAARNSEPLKHHIQRIPHP